MYSSNGLSTDVFPNKTNINTLKTQLDKMNFSADINKLLFKRYVKI